MNKWYKKFIPTHYFNSVYDINYESLKKEGIKALFFDLDNTVLPYDVPILPEAETKFLEDLAKDFKVVVVSNSGKKRVKLAVEHLKGIPYVSFAKKPLKFGFKKALKLVNVKPEDSYFIGDQILTDIYGSNRMKFNGVVLVYPVKKRSDHFITKNNRKLERIVIRKIKKKFPDKYEEVLKPYVERN